MTTPNPFDAIVAGSKARLRVSIDRELDALLQSVAVEHAPRLVAAEEAQRKLVQAQETARHNDRRIAKLEHEVANLRSVSYYKDKETQTLPNPNPDIGRGSQPPAKGLDKNGSIACEAVDIQDYHRIKAELAEANQDLERVIRARDKLETKCRFQKKHLKQWADYEKDWERNKGPRRSEGNFINRRPNLSQDGSEHARASSVPTQPLPPRKTTSLGTREFATLTTPSSVEIPASSDVPAESVEKKPQQSHAANPKEDNFPEALATTKLAGEDEAAETSDSNASRAESDTHISSGVQDVSLQGMGTEEDTDIPLFISARKLKRKRSQCDNSTGKVLKVCREEDVPGTASKPVHVKSDPCSSSPVTAIRSQALNGNHDSVDLDEVGSKTKTPRKHQRYRLEPADSQRSVEVQKANAGGSISQGDIEGHEESPNNGHDQRDAEGHEESLDAGHDQRANQNDESDDSVSLPFNQDASSKMRGAYANKLRQAQLENYHDGQPDRLATTSKLMMAQQRPRSIHVEQGQDSDRDILEAEDRQVADFNQRISEAQHRKLNDPRQLRTPKPAEVPAPRFDGDDQSSNYPFGLPTPTTIAHRPDPTLRNHGQEADKAKKSFSPSILRPTDANNQMLPRTSELLTKDKRQCPPSRRDRGAAQIHTVLEDGEETHSGRKAKKQAKPPVGGHVNATDDVEPDPKTSDVHYRLSTLLAEPSPGRPTLPIEKLNVPRRPDQQKSRTPPSDGRSRILPSEGMSPLPLPQKLVSNLKPAASLSKNKRQPVTHSKKPAPVPLVPLDPTSSEDPPPVLPEHEPLRSRPVNRLRREDFKINPAANHGFSHAYREVIRKRQERKCLPNCNRPDCCGNTIKKMIAIGGPLVQRKPGLFESSSPEHGQDVEGYDYNVLKEYMGDNYRNWARMSDKEKKDEWARAQEWDFGKKFGKHKAMDRQRTPPGYWMNDFENTQEAKELREETEKMAREEVAERWREAMRPGGVWKFADE